VERAADEGDALAHREQPHAGAASLGLLEVEAAAVVGHLEDDRASVAGEVEAGVLAPAWRSTFLSDSCATR
jgi:hypothetical protein